MSDVLKTGIAIGAGCAAWQLIMGLTGWYLDPQLQALFWLVIPIQLGALVWGLRRTRDEGRGYGGQVAAGTIASAVGGAILFCTSLVFTLVLFPSYFEDLRAMHATLLREQGMGEVEIRAAVEAAAATQTPLLQALFGLIGTVVTGLLLSLVVAAFVRRRAPVAADAKAQAAHAVEAGRAA